MNSPFIGDVLFSRRTALGLCLVLWNAIVAGSVALAATLIFLGRAIPTQATMDWALGYCLFFVAGAAWLGRFSTRLASSARGTSNLLASTVCVEAPLLALAVAGSTAIYLSDTVNHQVTYFLQPTPGVVLLLAVLATAIAQEGVLARCESKAILKGALEHCRPWVLPACLLLLGLLQDASYLWVIGNDFTRYWAISDGMRSLAGYPVSINMPSYIEGGMPRHSIEMPIFPLLLLLSFTLAGHDTVGAHLPALVANTVLPLLLYGFYHKAGFQRPLAFATAAAVATFPFFRLYTLNAPVPDPVFVALLVSTGWLFLDLTRSQDRGHQSYVPWLAFGLLAGITSLTRPEGLLFVGMMFLALLPNLLKPRLYAAGLAFLLPTVPFSLFMFFTFGIPWPQNGGASFSLQNISDNLDWLYWLSVPWYAGAFGLPSSSFGMLVSVVAVCAILGILWMLKTSWQASFLPIAASLHIIAVFTVNPKVAGADEWYDFFRHISYGMPFLILPIAFLTLAASGTIRSTLARGKPLLSSGRRKRYALLPLALALFLLTCYQLFLLSRPAQTWASGSQLLTSDVWVTLPDLVSHRYVLPKLPFVDQEGVRMIDPGFEYMSQHLEAVKAFFQPFSVLETGRGTQYEVSSFLILLFGALFVLGGGEGTDSKVLPKSRRGRLGLGGLFRDG